MENNYTERLEGPDGQYCVLLTRLPYGRAMTVEERSSAGRRPMSVFAQAVFRAHLWEVSVKDYLTGETTTEIDLAAPEVLAPWRDRAVELYVEWRKVAFPGPKGSSATAGPTPDTSKAPTSETAASE